MTESTPAAGPPPFGRQRTWLIVGGAASAEVVAFLVGTWLLPGRYRMLDVAGSAAVLIFILTQRLPADHPHARLGPAMSVTAFRAGLVTVLWHVMRDGRVGLAGWVVVGLASVAAVLDLADGPLARRTGLASRGGARFDMATDALLTLVLSVAVWQSGKAGLWVIASGAMFPVFLWTGYYQPWLAAELPPSVRRQAVCVVQIVALIVALVPAVTPPLSTAISAAGLAILTWSFYVDVAWLARHRDL